MIRTSGSSCGCLIAALVFCIIGVVFVAVAQGDIRDYRASSSWKTASGEITSSQLGITSDSDGTSYRAEITYFYLVGDQRYTGTRYKFGHTIYGGRGGAEETLTNYPVGKQVEVLYDPNNPTDSVIERNLGTGLLVFGGLGAAFIALTPFMMLGALFSPVLRLFRG